MFLVSLGMSWVAVRMKKTRQQDQAVEEIRKLGGSVSYDYEIEESGGLTKAGRPGRAWLRHLLGEHFFETPVAVVFTSRPGLQVTDAGLEHSKGLTQLHRTSL